MNEFEISICNNDIKSLTKILLNPNFDLSSNSNFALTVILNRKYYDLLNLIIEDKRLNGTANHNNAFNSTITLEQYDISIILLKNKKIKKYVLKNNIEAYNKILQFQNWNYCRC